MNEGCLHGSETPCACASAMTSVAASSTTLKPSSSNWRSIAVFPEPGAPVSMNLFIEPPVLRSASCGRPSHLATAKQIDKSADPHQTGVVPLGCAASQSQPHGQTQR